MLTFVAGLAGGTLGLVLARSARAAGVAARLPHRRPAARSSGAVRARLSRARLARALAAADLDWTPDEAARTWAVAVVCAAVLGAPFGVTALALTATTVALAGPAALWSARHRRDRVVARALPDLLEEVARELRSGGTVASAVARVAGGDGVLAAETAGVARRAELGLGLDDGLSAWLALRQDAPVGDDVAVVAGALTVAARTGGPAADALDGVAAAVRDRHSALAEAWAQGAQGRLSAVVVGALPAVALAVSVVSDGSAARMLVVHPLGRIALVAGLAAEALGAWWMHRIVRVTP